MSRMTRSVVLASALVALIVGFWLLYRNTTLFWLAIVAWGLLAVLGGKFPRVALGLVLPAVYLIPAAFRLAVGRNEFGFTLLWMGGLAVVMTRTSWRNGWSLPASWRWPLLAVALAIALSWPAVALRELDFTLANLWNGRLPVAGAKISGAGAVVSVAFSAATQLLGLLWFDWLWNRFARNEPGFIRTVVTPLAGGLIVSCGIGVYQGFVDVSFLSGHVWPSVQRAAGTLMDANVFGMLAALWGPAFLVLAARGRGVASVVLGAAGLLISWLGVWVSGSRTATLAAGLGVLIAAFSLGSRITSSRVKRALLASLPAAALVFGVVMSTLPAGSQSPLNRARYLWPSLSADGVRKTALELWTRDGYGTAATAMIAEFPFQGVGVGCFTILVHDFGEEAGLLLPPDNAQNWFRHQLAELGLVGSIGWFLWAVAFLWALRPRRGTGREPGLALRGPLLAFGVASLVGMPGHEGPIVFTFWLLAFWYGRDAGVEPGNGQRFSRAALALCLLAVAYAGTMAIPNDLRPPFRAARFGFPYSYGVYPEGADQVWTAEHGVTVLDATQDWLKLTVWVSHPDADRKPVSVDVWVDRDHVINDRVRRGERIYRHVRVPKSRRFVLEAKVDRTFRPSEHGQSSDDRDLGLAMKWEFVERPPG